MQQGEKKEGKTGKETGKMAGAAKDAPMDVAPLTREEFNQKIDRMEGDYLKKIKDTVMVLAGKLEELTTSVQKIAETAETAMELGLTLQEDMKTLQQHDSEHFEKLLILENSLKKFNLKLRGMEENAEENVDLVAYLSTWLAQAWKAEWRWSSRKLLELGRRITRSGSIRGILLSCWQTCE